MKRKATQGAGAGAGGRTGGLRRSRAPPCWIPPSCASAAAASTCPLHSHSAPGKFRRWPSIHTSPFAVSWNARGLFLTLLSTSPLSPHAAGCSLEWHFTSESLSHAGSSSPSGSRFSTACLSVAALPLIAKPFGGGKLSLKYLVVYLEL